MKYSKPADSTSNTENEKQTDRRDFVKSAGLTALGMSATPFLFSGCKTKTETDEKQPPSLLHQSNLEFPKGFLWGTATASYQV